MTKVRYLTPLFAVTGAVRPDDIRAAAALGFKAIISNIPDSEAGAPLSSAEEARFAAQAGLDFRHIPSTRHEVFSDRVVEGMLDALSTVNGPVLGHCASGARTALAWAAAAARHQGAGCILAVLSEAGFDLAPVREELEEQRTKPRRRDLPAPLDCGCGED